MAEKINRRKGIGTLGNKKADLWFCLLLLLWPTVQFAVFYVGVNFNSFVLMFQKLTSMGGGVSKLTTSFANFQSNLNWFGEFLGSKNFTDMLKMSLLCWVCSITIGSPLGLLFSYYIAKKFPGSSFFRVLLYLPSIISGLILMLLFKNFVDNPLSKDIFHMAGSLTAATSSASTRIFILIFFNIWSGFGVSVLMYANAMSGISPEIIEAAELDGAKGFREFIHISFPMIFPTYSVFFVTSLTSIFTNQANILSLYGTGASPEMQTFGYYMYVQVKSGENMYPKMALMGIVLSFIAIPVTLIVRKLMEKYGPSEK